MNLAISLAGNGINDIRTCEDALLAQRKQPVTILGHTIKKLTRGQAREILAVVRGEAVAELFSTGLTMDLSDPAGLQKALDLLLETVEGLLDLVLDYGSDYPGGLDDDGKPRRDSFELDEQLAVAGAVLIVNFKANAAIRLFSGGVGSAAQPESEPSTEPTSGAAARSEG
jgi:hypothetical protein